MRNLSIVMLVAILMTSVGVYAASISGTSKTIGGTGTVTVSAPASAVTAKYNLDSAGKVASVDVTWTPTVSLNYTIDVQAGTSGHVPSGGVRVRHPVDHV